jgi:hypothetical protein
VGLEAQVKGYKTTDQLDKLILEVGLKDLEQALRLVAGQVIQEQIDLGNPPTSILVDGRGTRDIDRAQRRVQAFFADTEALRKAFYEAWSRVIALTRVKSGRAAASYQVWFNNTPIGSTPSAIDGYIKNFNPAKDAFRIVGPVLVYGRKVYWKPAGTPRFEKRIGLKTPTAVFKLVRIRGIMNQVEQSLRRKYRYLAITEDWVVTSALPTDGRTPGLWLGFKRKGTVLR